MKYLLQREFATQNFVWGTLKRFENGEWVNVCKTIEPPLTPRKNDGKVYHALPEGKYSVETSFDKVDGKLRIRPCIFDKKDDFKRTFIASGHNFRTCAGNINVGMALENGAIGVLVDTRATCEKITREVRDTLLNHGDILLRICDIKWRV